MLQDHLSARQYRFQLSHSCRLSVISPCVDDYSHCAMGTERLRRARTQPQRAARSSGRSISPKLPHLRVRGALISKHDTATDGPHTQEGARGRRTHVPRSAALVAGGLESGFECVPGGLLDDALAILEGGELSATPSSEPSRFSAPSTSMLLSRQPATPHWHRAPARTPSSPTRLGRGRASCRRTRC